MVRFDPATHCSGIPPPPCEASERIDPCLSMSGDRAQETSPSAGKTRNIRMPARGLLSGERCVEISSSYCASRMKTFQLFHFRHVAGPQIGPRSSAAESRWVPIGCSAPRRPWVDGQRTARPQPYSSGESPVTR